ncbi:MAG TPA: hypothetical protein VGD60_02510 [Candidatus Acidoferrales bacterium]
MCPACIAAAALIAVKVSSAGGLASAFAGKLASKADLPKSSLKKAWLARNTKRT